MITKQMTFYRLTDLFKISKNDKNTDTIFNNK